MQIVIYMIVIRKPRNKVLLQSKKEKDNASSSIHNWMIMGIIYQTVNVGKLRPCLHETMICYTHPSHKNPANNTHYIHIPFSTLRRNGKSPLRIIGRENSNKFSSPAYFLKGLNLSNHPQRHPRHYPSLHSM